MFNRFRKNILPFLLTILVTLLVLVAIIDYLNFHVTYSFIDNPSGLKNFTQTTSMVLLLSAALAAIVAWRQLSNLNKTAFADLLSKVESRYGSLEVLEARRIIHQVYLESKRKNLICEKCHLERMQKKIKLIGQSKNKTQEFIMLLNFLDFLESVSYYALSEYMDENDINEMFGNNLPYWFTVFSLWIEYRRKKFNEPKMYKCFEDIAIKMDPKICKIPKARISNAKNLCQDHSTKL